MTGGERARGARRGGRGRRGGQDPLTRLRAVCAALPEVTEKIAWGAPTFRVRDKVLVMFADDHHGDGRVAMWCKAGPGAQEMLVGDGEDPRYFVPPYVGPKGWVGVRLDLDVDWDLVRELVEDAWRLTAPARLLPLLGDEADRDA